MTNAAVLFRITPGARWWRSMFVLLAMCLGPLLLAQEICDNGVDDDGNGLVDLNDLDGCPCALTPPTGNLIVNGSFEEHSCCPEAFADFACVNGWTPYYVSATPDYINCDFVPASMPQPVPDGSGVAGMGAFTDWSHSTSHYEFITNCLSTPLAAGTDHEMTFRIAADRVTIVHQFPWMIPTNPINIGPIDMVVYGFATCPTAPYVIIEPIFGIPEPAVYCPTEFGWTPLGSVTYNPNTAWEELSIHFTAPFDVAAIMFGPACPVPADYISYQSTWPYFFLDDMAIVPVQVGIESTGHPCTNDLVLTSQHHQPLAYDYQWYFNGVAIVGETGGTLNATALGLGDGIYTLRAVDHNGDCTMARTEVSSDPPIPMLVATPTSGCAPLTVALNNATPPQWTAALAWDLGDGSTSTASTLTHQYHQPGSYDVRLTVTSPDGCVGDSLFEGLITVHPVPIVTFTSDTLLGCVGMGVNFTNTTSVNGDPSCTWAFGDGGTSNDCNTSYAFQGPGLFDVQLTVTTAHGCTADSLIAGMIEILSTPEPDMAIQPASGCIPLEVRFTNLTPGVDEQTALWDLGNGSTSTLAHPDAVYDTPGSYTVSLTMTNSLGCSATVHRQDAIHAHGLPTVTFSVEPDTGCAPLQVQFTNSTDPGMIGSCHWAFGDGSSANSCATDHLYRNAGSYTVSLTVTSPAGCEGDTTIHHMVHVFPSPVAHFTHDPAPTDLFHTEIDFQDGSSNDVIAWHWALPGALPPTADSARFSATYPVERSGEYPVQLVVWNEFGCSDTTDRIVVVEGVFSVYVPNAFTPNADGFNDLFLPVLRDIDTTNYVLRIFNRWGKEVFATTDPEQGWDGTVGGEEPKTDVYPWRILVHSGVNAEAREIFGHVTLLR